MRDDTTPDTEHERQDHDTPAVKIARITRESATQETSTFTCREWVALLLLRHRYQEGHDLWSERELARLRFLRWRYETGDFAG